MERNETQIWSVNHGDWFKTDTADWRMNRLMDGPTDGQSADLKSTSALPIRDYNII